VLDEELLENVCIIRLDYSVEDFRMRVKRGIEKRATNNR
jgi:hypothetical protein